MRERLGANIGKHGSYNPLPLRVRIEKIGRHFRQYMEGQSDEDHLCALACQSLLALKALADEDAEALDVKEIK